MHTAELMALEVKWYRKHGRYPERILRDNKGNEYVAGDWSWNHNRLTHEKEEFIEHLMYAQGIHGS